jgi:SurA-like N-terminal domain
MLPRLCLVVLVFALAGCGGSSDQTLASVGEQQVTAEQVDGLVEEAVAELRREGKAVPEEKSAGERTLERRALAILVGRARLAQKADDLGVTVSADEIRERIGAASPGDSEEEGDSDFVTQQVRAQLLYEKLFARVTGGVAVSAAEVRAHYDRNRALYGSRTFAEVRAGIRDQLLGARRNAAMKLWLERVTRQLPARYTK